jgi:hypothetical protein
VTHLHVTYSLVSAQVNFLRHEMSISYDLPGFIFTALYNLLGILLSLQDAKHILLSL